MDGEFAGAQVAPPPMMFLHHRLYDPQLPPQPPGRKRDSPPPPQHLKLMGSANWNPNRWHWDSLRFAAESKSATEEDSEILALKLGGVAYEKAPAPADEMVPVRANKRVRSASPGNGRNGRGSYPMCQVDDCRADLSSAKDYHRRHKVCELHSKTTKALVAKQMQRFCQQCSRFHLLSEFDEGKRSCRRRLAGHNRRRRKIQPEDASSRSLVPGNHENVANGGSDLVNLLAILARLQGSTTDKLCSLSSMPDKDWLLQILSKLTSLPMTNTLSKPSGGFDLNISQDSQQTASEQVSEANGNPSVPLTVDLLAALFKAVAGSPSDTQASISRGSSDISGDEKAKLPCTVPAADIVSHNSSAKIFSLQEVSQCLSRQMRSTLPLQLFTSAEDDSPPKLGSARKCLSSESSNPIEEISPSSSPPFAQSLFPLSPQAEALKHESMSVCRDDNSAIELSTSRGWNAPLELFKGSERHAANGVQSVPYRGGYASSSGSDHSPSSSNSDAQVRTGRIIFKLFDKDPSSLPASLRNQILSWLSHSPSDMESYIRPGCVVLSVYASMPSSAWDELEEDLLHRVNSLLQGSDAEFWRDGRFLVRTSRQLASHKAGKVQICKYWKTWSAPELTSVSPVAIVSGEESSLVLRGRNLTVPGTKIHCTYMGGYISKEVLHSTYPGTIYDDSSSDSFSLPGGSPNVYGRCFIEVENGFKGNSFPIIVADAATCRELRNIESELEKDVNSTDVIQEDYVQDFGRPKSREDALHFLNELGWLLQRRSISSSPFATDFSMSRFMFLLTFSVERDWSTLVKILLDMLAERCLARHGMYDECMEMLLEVQLLSRAVKRRCRKMVALLLNYSVVSGVEGSTKYVFPPNSVGPGGLTPLHLAAATQDSEDIIDALTSDPQGIGLSCWNYVKDNNGHSPYSYASMRNNHSYNRLIATKIADLKDGQISITINNEDDACRLDAKSKTDVQVVRAISCAQCSLMKTRGFRPYTRSRGLLQRPYVHSMLAIAAVCVCVCLFFRGAPDLGSVAPFTWENLEFGPR